MVAIVVVPAKLIVCMNEIGWRMYVTPPAPATGPFAPAANATTSVPPVCGKVPSANPNVVPVSCTFPVVP